MKLQKLHKIKKMKSPSFVKVAKTQNYKFNYPMEKWQYALLKEYAGQMNEKPNNQMDVGSMTLITETSQYWLIRYDEGGGEFLNLVYKKGDRPMQTVEV